MVFENRVKNIQAAAYNGARTVLYFDAAVVHICPEIFNLIQIGPGHTVIVDSQKHKDF